VIEDYHNGTSLSSLFLPNRYKKILDSSGRKEYKEAMKINISIFQCLDGIARERQITDDEWAVKAKIRRPTISELRRIARNPNEKTGRSCTIEKVTSLYNGLTKLLGGEALRQHIERCIEKEPNQTTRITLLALATSDADQEGKDLIEQTMKMVLKAKSQKR
jgi:hypothetical protein